MPRCEMYRRKRRIRSERAHFTHRVQAAFSAGAYSHPTCTGGILKPMPIVTHRYRRHFSAGAYSIVYRRDFSAGDYRVAHRVQAAFCGR